MDPPAFAPTRNRRKVQSTTHRHWLGTADTAKMCLTQMIYGTRISMTIGLVAVSHLSVDRHRGRRDGRLLRRHGSIMLISRIIEIVLLFPAFFLILTLVGLIGPSIYIIMVVIGITGWPGIAR